MPKLVDLMEPLKYRRTFGFFDDFEWMITAHRWTTVVADVVSTVGIAVADGANGLLTVSPEDATDEDEVYLKSTIESFKFAADKPGVWECRLKFAEANTNKANVFFGVADAIGANTLVDAGAGMKTSYSGAVFFKQDGQTLWSVQSSLSTTQTTTQLSAVNSKDGRAHTAGSTAFQTLRIEYTPITTTNGDLDFWLDGVLVAKHDYVFTNATEMQVGLGLKNGSTTPETMTVDYIGAFQIRT